MGVDYHACAAIGVAVDREQVFKKELIKVGQHDFGRDVRYHPGTGRKLWEEKEVPIGDGFDEDMESFGGRFSIITSTDSRFFVICACRHVCTGSSRSRGSCDDRVIDLEWDKIPEAKRELQGALEPLGLWDESRFGLHAVLVCSY